MSLRALLWWRQPFSVNCWTIRTHGSGRFSVIKGIRVRSQRIAFASKCAQTVEAIVGGHAAQRKWLFSATCRNINTSQCLLDSGKPERSHAIVKIELHNSAQIHTSLQADPSLILCHSRYQDWQSRIDMEELLVLLYRHEPIRLICSTRKSVLLTRNTCTKLLLSEGTNPCLKYLDS